jgi:hypothetical protein
MPVLSTDELGPPVPRTNHASATSGSIVFFFGGQCPVSGNETVCVNDVCYIDLGKPKLALSFFSNCRRIERN